MGTGAANGRGLRPEQKILYGMGCVVTLVWSIAVIVPLIFPSREVSSQVHVVMVLVAGGCFALGGVRTPLRRNGNGKENGNGA